MKIEKNDYLFIFFLIITIIWWRLHLSANKKPHFHGHNYCSTSSEFNGVIETISKSKSRAVYLKNHQFGFTIIAKPLDETKNQTAYLYDFLQVDDSILKRKNIDTLYIFRDSNEYQWPLISYD